MLTRVRRSLLLLMLALPASAEAAPLGELPFQRLPDGAACLAPTGAPGELSRWAEGGAQVLTAGPDELGRPALVPLGALTGCPRAAGNASGAAVIAGTIEDALRVAVREPGGGSFSAPMTLAAAESVVDLSVAVSAHGDAVVAWSEYDFSPPRVRTRVARRDAGGAFGAPADLVPWHPDTGTHDVFAGMSGNGETVVLARTPTGSTEDADSLDTLRTGARGAPLGPPTALPAGVTTRALAVAADGRALLAATGGGSIHALERSPSGAVGAPQRLTDPRDSVNADQVAVALGGDARAVVAWHDEDTGTTGAAVRDGAPGFGAPVVIVPAPKGPFEQSFGVGPAVVYALPSLQAAVAPDGRASVAWPDREPRLVTLAGNAVVERRRVGSPLREADGLSLLTLPDGRRALAWTNADKAEDDSPARVHYAVEGRPAAPEPAAPRVTVGRPRQTALRPGQRLTVPVRCSAACDLRVTLAGERDHAVDQTLTRAGNVDVVFAATSRPLAPARPGPVRITVRSSAPGSRAVTRTISEPRLRRLPALPFPRVEAVRTRRLGGGRLEVRWRMTGDASETLLAAVGTRTKGRAQDPDAVLEALWGGRRRSYRVVLEDAADLRWVHVQVFQNVGDGRRSVTVRVG